MALIQAHAVLFLEASALKEIQPRMAGAESKSEIEEEDSNGEEKTYCKKLEPSLHKYVETWCCQCDIVNKLFDNLPGCPGM